MSGTGFGPAGVVVLPPVPWANATPVVVSPSVTWRIPAVSLLPVEALHQKSVPVVVITDCAVGPPPPATLKWVVVSTSPETPMRAIVMVDAAVPVPTIDR